jgi:hypothetical protein
MFILQRLISFLIPFHSHARCSDDSLTIPSFRIQLTRENKSQSAKGFASEGRLLKIIAIPLFSLLQDEIIS